MNNGFAPQRGFSEPKLSKEWYDKLTSMAKDARGNIIKMTSLAASGHPGGSMSSLEIYLTLYNMANVDPDNPNRDDRDRIIVSHGHTSPGVYSALAEAGFFKAEDAIVGFRQAGSPFEGHVEKSVPGIEWGTGNLGQGLAVGIGKAIYARLSKQNFHTYVVMGDGEQQKGQISESRKIAVKYKLSKLTVLIDYNQLQISGNIRDVMPQNIAEEWRADGWKVLEVNGHDLDQIYDSLHKAYRNENSPIMILAHTVMGKGVSFMENDEGFHGAPVKMDKVGQALEELGVDNNIEDMQKQRAARQFVKFDRNFDQYPDVSTGDCINYDIDDKIDCRGAFGKALVSLADANMNRNGFNMAVFDCDLAGSVKTQGFADKYPESFFQFGITEHSTSAAMGSLSAEKAIGVWADFGVFATAETYNQARLNDINHANAKLFCTHCGLNVGEDGMTHQSIDYFGLLNSTFSWKVITPSDGNHTDKIVRYVLSNPGNFAVIMGRSAIPIITDENGKPFYGEGYHYQYGRMDTIRAGQKIAIVAAGNMLSIGLEAYNKIKETGPNVGLVCVSDWSDLHPDDIKMLGGFEAIVTLEDHNVKTGLGAALTEALHHNGFSTRAEKIGVTRFAGSGKPADLYKAMGMDAESVSERVKKLM